MKAYKTKEVIQLLLEDGWYQLKSRKTSGDHFQFKHPNKPGKVTVNGALNKEMD
jgi:predicted RNA binding protein YcfA (HicA-like mRNA interferase family)